MQDILDMQEQGGVLRLTMNRPERLNALNPALATALRTCFQGLYHRPEVRVLLVPMNGLPGPVPVPVVRTGDQPTTGSNLDNPFGN